MATAQSSCVKNSLHPLTKGVHKYFQNLILAKRGMGYFWFPGQQQAERAEGTAGQWYF